MTTAATIAARLILDSSDYQSGLKKAESSADSFARKMEKVGAKMQKVGAVMSAAFTVPIGIALKQGIDLASGYDEALNKVNVVFEDSAGVIEKWSKDSATALGLSQGAALEAAGTFGNLFTAQGMGASQAADMSTAIVQLSADLASFNNASPEDTLLALRSGLSGEIEPLKKYGVAMNQAMLETQAMKMGLGDNIQALTEAQKVQVRYALIMEQTSKAQGDFARTSDGLANQQRILKAQFDDSLRLLGQNLLPVVLKFTTALNKMLESFTNAPPFVQKGVLALLGLLALAGPVLTFVGTILQAASALSTLGVSFAGVSTAITTIGASLGAILLPLAAVIAVITAIYLAWKNWDQVVAGAKLITGAYKKAFSDVSDWAKKTFADIKKGSKESTAALSESLNDWMETVQKGFGVFKSRMSSVWQSIVSGFTGAFQWISRTAQTVFNAVAGAIAKLIGYIRQLVQAFKDIVVPDVLKPGSPTPFEIGLRGIGDAMQNLYNKSIPEMNAGINSTPAAVAQVGGGRMTYNDNRTFSGGMSADELKVALDRRFVDTVAGALA